MPDAEPVFVVQRHDARNLHFDLRLEIDGVLVSWAVPKGPSLDPDVKRLAVLTTDHELAYAEVEGRFGTSTVIVWDTGSLDHATAVRGVPVPAGDALAAGHLRFVLHGHRLLRAHPHPHGRRRPQLDPGQDRRRGRRPRW